MNVTTLLNLENFLQAASLFSIPTLFPNTHDLKKWLCASSFFSFLPGRAYQRFISCAVVVGTTLYPKWVLSDRKKWGKVLSVALRIATYLCILTRLQYICLYQLVPFRSFTFTTAIGLLLNTSNIMGEAYALERFSPENISFFLSKLGRLYSQSLFSIRLTHLRENIAQSMVEGNADLEHVTNWVTSCGHLKEIWLHEESQPGMCAQVTDRLLAQQDAILNRVEEEINTRAFDKIDLARTLQSVNYELADLNEILLVDTIQDDARKYRICREIVADFRRGGGIPPELLAQLSPPFTEDPDQQRVQLAVMLPLLKTWLRGDCRTGRWYGARIRETILSILAPTECVPDLIARLGTLNLRVTTLTHALEAPIAPLPILVDEPNTPEVLSAMEAISNTALPSEGGNTSIEAISIALGCRMAEIDEKLREIGIATADDYVQRVHGVPNYAALDQFPSLQYHVEAIPPLLAYIHRFTWKKKIVATIQALVKPIFKIALLLGCSYLVTNKIDRLSTFICGVCLPILSMNHHFTRYKNLIINIYRLALPEWGFVLAFNEFSRLPKKFLAITRTIAAMEIAIINPSCSKAFIFEYGDSFFREIKVHVFPLLRTLKIIIRRPVVVT